MRSSDRTRCSMSHKAHTKCWPRLCSPLELRVFSQPYLGCWQNSVPCDYRNEDPIISEAVGQAMLSASGAFCQVLTKWLCPQTIQNMGVCFFKASRIIFPSLNLFFQKTEPFLQGLFKGLTWLGQTQDNLSFVDLEVNWLQTLITSVKSLHLSHIP